MQLARLLFPAAAAAMLLSTLSYQRGARVLGAGLMVFTFSVYGAAALGFLG